MSNVVLIRADGSKKIGMGHLSRACLISDMLRRRFSLQSKLIMKKDLLAEYFIRNRGIETILISELASNKEEIELMRWIVETEKPLLFVLDVLKSDTADSYIKIIRKFSCPIVAITDDNNHRIIDADIILNGNPNQLGQDYSGNSGRYLLGPMYFLMDLGSENIKTKEPGGEVRKVLLTFGGSDQNNLLFQTLVVFEKIKPNFSILVITSKATGYVERLKGYLQQLHISYELLVDVKNFLPFWEKCDLAITAAGNTLFERIASRLPGATLCQFERQMKIADCFESLGVNVNFGFGPALSRDVLLRRITEFIENKKLQYLQYKRASEIIDGKGLKRLGNEIQSLLKDYSDELRRTGKAI